MGHAPDMARKLRLQYPGAIYHLMSRGDRREPVFLEDADRSLFVSTLSEACAKTDWQVHGYGEGPKGTAQPAATKAKRAEICQGNDCQGNHAENGAEAQAFQHLAESGWRGFNAKPQTRGSKGWAHKPCGGGSGTVA